MPRGTIRHTKIGNETVEHGEFRFDSGCIYYRLHPLLQWTFLCEDEHLVSFVPDEDLSSYEEGEQA